ncbi:MAG: dTDP-4-dehydrorhamnose reductase [Nitrososphaerota archaeon]|nr:dTDP-4-dehydrorhamnose reductase [Nitrososphaerota archaeon]
MKVLVTGAGGLLGSAVASLASEEHEVFAAFNKHFPACGTAVKLDLLDGEGTAAAVAKVRPDAIVHSAALTDVDRCEANRDLAEKVNHDATKALSKLAKRAGAFFLYVSTDYVFDGARGMYREEDQANPINLYGLTKLRGEQAVEASGAEFCIARGSVIYGAHPAAGKVNFALWLIENLRRGEHVRVLRDQHVSPTLNLSFARMILEALERRLTGIFHMAGASRVSRYDFAVALADAFGLDPSLIEPVTMDEMKWVAKRPTDSSLDVSKAASLLSEKPLLLPDALLKLKHALTGGNES